MPETLRFVDVNGLGGFLAYGTTLAGFELTHRTGNLQFGAPLAETNRHHLGSAWTSEYSDNPDEWHVPSDISYATACPPCSGWSVWSGNTYRGVDSPAHEHTRKTIRYFARVKAPIMAFECVQQAYSQGRDAMVIYREMLEELSGKKYDLYHVKHNNLQVGGFSFRPRYFWTAVEHGMPFGAAAPGARPLPTIVDIISDLADLPWTWNKQPYRRYGSRYVEHLRSRDGLVDGHIGKQNIAARRVGEVFDALGSSDSWDSGADLSSALRKAVQTTGQFPPSWTNLEEKLLKNDFSLGFSQPYRWRADSWVNVLTGSALEHVVHPTRGRLITHREAARMQGLPDSWEISPVQDYSALQATWGKAVPVQASQWMGEMAKAALLGCPVDGPVTQIGDREYLVDTDKGFTRVSARKLLVEQMAARAVAA